MMQKIKDHILFIIVFVLAMVAAIFLCSTRFQMEQAHNSVAFVIAQEDLALLASAAQIPIETYEAQLREAGLSDVIVPEDPQNALGVYFYGEEDGTYRSSSAVLGLNEDIKQFSYISPEGFVPDGTVTMERTLRLYRYMGNRYGILGYPGAEEIENIIFRAITDRNIRIIWITPFYHNETEQLISSPAEYTNVMQQVEKRIAAHGLIVGSEVAPFPPAYTPSLILLLPVFWGICAAGIFLLYSVSAIFREKKRMRMLLLLFSMLCATILSMVQTAQAIILFSFAASVIFPCLAFWIITLMLQQQETGKSMWDMLRTFFQILCVGVCISLIGGIWIGGMQSATRYLLAIDNFRGVKASQLLPLLYGVYIVFFRLYGKGGFKAWGKEMLAGKKVIFAVFLVGILCASLLFILRTGDGMIQVSALEQQVRNFFEETFIVRPRTKEFLVSWPCMAVALLLLYRRYPAYALPFAIMAAPGLSSVVNTFCHSRAPLWLSGVRTILGLFIGALLGMFMIALLYFYTKDRIRK